MADVKQASLNKLRATAPSKPPGLVSFFLSLFQYFLLQKVAMNMPFKLGKKKILNDHTSSSPQGFLQVCYGTAWLCFTSLLKDVKESEIRGLLPKPTQQ